MRIRRDIEDVLYKIGCVDKSFSGKNTSRNYASLPYMVKKLYQKSQSGSRKVPCVIITPQEIERYRDLTLGRQIFLIELLKWKGAC